MAKKQVSFRIDEYERNYLDQLQEMSDYNKTEIVEALVRFAKHILLPKETEKEQTFHDDFYKETKYLFGIWLHIKE